MRIKMNLRQSANDSFYRPVSALPHQDVSVCEEFLQYEMGVKSKSVSIELSTIRPHQKGWHKIDITDSLNILLDGIGTHGIGHSRLLSFLRNNGIGYIFWIRVTELPQV